MIPQVASVGWEHGSHAIQVYSYFIIRVHNNIIHQLHQLCLCSAPPHCTIFSAHTITIHHWKVENWRDAQVITSKSNSSIKWSMQLDRAVHALVLFVDSVCDTYMVEFHKSGMFPKVPSRIITYKKLQQIEDRNQEMEDGDWRHQAVLVAILVKRLEEWGRRIVLLQVLLSTGVAFVDFY